MPFLCSVFSDHYTPEKVNQTVDSVPIENQNQNKNAKKQSMKNNNYSK